MLTVQFYTRKNCKLCEEAFVLLELLQTKYKFNIDKRDIETNDNWLEEFHVIIPVIKIGDTVLNNNMIDIEKIDHALQRYTSQ